MDELGYRRLAAAIALKAVKDWRSLIRAHAWEEEHTIYNKNFEELRSFFRSGYCQLLLTGSNLSPTYILETLEKELEEAKANPKPREVSGFIERY